MDKKQAKAETLQPSKFSVIFDKTWSVIKIIGEWIYRLRAVIVSLPVIVVAIIQAVKNIGRLPEKVGFLLQESGEFKYLISKNMAVMAPLALTCICLLLVFCSRRILFPWLISAFTLLLPILIWITNVFPA